MLISRHQPIQILAPALLVVWLVCAGLAAAAEPVGELELIAGKAKIHRLGKSIMMDKPNSRSPDFERDIIVTAGKSKARLKLRKELYDGRDVSTDLYARTHFVVNTASAQGSSFMMGLGKVFFSVGAKLRGKRFQLSTPTATIGVKGTKFVVGSEAGKTFTVTIEGVVSVVSHAFQQLEILTEINTGLHGRGQSAAHATHHGSTRFAAKNHHYGWVEPVQRHQVPTSARRLRRGRGGRGE